MEIKYRAHRVGDTRGQPRNSQDAVEANFGAKVRPPLGPLARVVWVLGVLVLIWGGVLCYLIFRPMSPDPTTVGTVQQQVVAAPQWQGPQPQWQGPQPQQIADKFLAANTQQERLRWVREPAAVAAIMERFYRDGPGAAEKVAGIGKMPQVTTDDQVFERFTVTMTDGSKRLLCVPFDESGAGVDFKSYARYGSEPWSAVLDGTVAKADEMRVFLEPGDYYNHEFTDERQWLCLIASSPDLENPIYLYARRDNPDLLLFLKNPPKEPQRYVIAIENPGEGHYIRQWQLKRVIATGWVTP